MIAFLKRNSTLILLCIFALGILLFRLQSSPPLLSQDEASFTNASFNVSSNLHDENNRLLPLYFETLSTRLTDWKNPFLVYWTAIFVKVFGFSVFSTRFSCVMLGIITIIFLWRTVKLIFPQSKSAPLISCLFLITSPLFIIQSRIVIDPITMVTMTMIELYYLVSYYQTQRKSDLIIASIFAGINFYSYSPARLFSGLILILGIALLTKYEGLKKKEILLGIIIPGIIFLLFVLPTIIWQIRFPGLVTSSYVGKLLPFNLENISSGYWVNYLRYFDPSFLFGTGDADLLHSTGRAGVFMLAGLPLIIFGIFSLCDKYKEKINLFLLILFVIYPFCIFILNQPYRACLSIYMLNFFPIIFAFGWEHLIKNHKKIAYCCLLALLIQFPVVLYDFYYKYPIRTQLSWKYNFQLASQIEKMLVDANSNPSQKYYIDNNIWFAIDDLIYYENIHKIHPLQNIIFTDDISVSSQSGSFLLTNRFNGEGALPIGSKIKSGWEGYYILIKK